MESNENNPINKPENIATPGLDFSVAEKYQEITNSSEDDLKSFKQLASDVPNLPSDPKEALATLIKFLQEKGFSYDVDAESLHDVISKKAGNCLGLVVLIGALLKAQGRNPECKILIHPKDAQDEADQKLFDDLMRGQYFSYDNPELPPQDDQPDMDTRVNRFAPLSHPIIMLDGIPLETTSIADQQEDPVVEFPAEAVTECSLEQIMSYLYSDQAKSLIAQIASAKGIEKEKLEILFKACIDQSLAIDPNNPDALQLKWELARTAEDKDLQQETIRRFAEIGSDNSQYNYRLWKMTGDEKYLDKSLEQFPQNIYAFLDKKVLLEPDQREARFNLAVALWCAHYSNSLNIDDFYSNPVLKEKIKTLYPNA